EAPRPTQHRALYGVPEIRGGRDPRDRGLVPAASADRRRHRRAREPGHRPPADELGRMMRTGLLLPHFGEHADPAKIIEGAKLAERLGFDSVWVRDHVVFEPHGEFEKPDPTF